MAETLFCNPVLAFIIVIVVLLLGGVFKFSKFVIKTLMIVGIAYIILNIIGVFA
jgi:hypothetical protein